MVTVVWTAKTEVVANIPATAPIERERIIIIQVIVRTFLFLIAFLCILMRTNCHAYQLTACQEGLISGIHTHLHYNKHVENLNGNQPSTVKGGISVMVPDAPPLQKLINQTYHAVSQLLRRSVKQHVEGCERERHSVEAPGLSSVLMWMITP
jgi:hypothetical protein